MSFAALRTFFEGSSVSRVLLWLTFPTKEVVIKSPVGLTFFANFRSFLRGVFDASSERRQSDPGHRHCRLRHLSYATRVKISGPPYVPESAFVEYTRQEKMIEGCQNRIRCRSRHSSSDFAPSEFLEHVSAHEFWSSHVVDNRVGFLFRYMNPPMHLVRDRFAVQSTRGSIVRNS